MREHCWLRLVMSCCGAQSLRLKVQGFDRCHSLNSLNLPPAALVSLPTSILLRINNTRLYQSFLLLSSLFWSDYRSFPRLRITAAEIISAIPRTVKRSALSWKRNIPRSDATTGSTVEITAAWDAGTFDRPSVYRK